MCITARIFKNIPYRISKGYSFVQNTEKKYFERHFHLLQNNRSLSILNHLHARERKKDRFL